MNSSSMKKRLIAFIVIAAVILVSAAAAVIYVNSKKGDIEFPGSTLYGDIEKADGLTVVRHVQYKDRAKWDSTISFEDGAYEADTVFKDQYERDRDSEVPQGDYIYIGVDSEKLREKIDYDTLKKEEDGLYRARVADYQKYYDVTFEIYDEKIDEWIASDNEIPENSKEAANYLEIQKCMKEKFKVPVREDLYVVFDESDGRPDKNEYEYEGLDGFAMNDVDAGGKNYLFPNSEVFFTDCLETGSYSDNYKRLDEEEEPDFSMMAEGYGLYEYSVEEEQAEIHKVFTPDQGDVIDGVFEMENDHDILIITYGRDNMKGYIFDNEKNKVMQKMNLGEGSYMGHDPGFQPPDCIVRQDGKYTWIVTGHVVIILEKKNGRYVKDMDFRDSGKLEIARTPVMDAAFDGKRAAIAGIPGDEDGSYTEWTGGFGLAVIEDDKLVFSGIYGCSLDESVFRHVEGLTTRDTQHEGCIKVSWTEQ